MKPQSNLPDLIRGLKVKDRFIVKYDHGGFSLYEVKRKRDADKVECTIVNGAHSATFNTATGIGGYGGRTNSRIVFVRTAKNCKYTQNNYNIGLGSFERDWEEK